MFLERIRLRHFRNYSFLDFEIPQGVVVITGENGQGKTNLIEGIYVLLRGQSFRPTTTESFPQIQISEPTKSPGCLIQGVIREGPLHHQLEWGLREGKKVHRWNEKAASPAALSRRFPIVLFSPESLGSIKEGAESRRQLVDELLSIHSAAGAKVLRDYKKCLRMRNRVLKNFKNGETSEMATARLLESLDPVFLPLAAEVAFGRIAALRSLQPEFESAIQYIMQSAVHISVDYVVSSQNVWGWDRSQLVSAMHQRSLELRRAEMESGVSLVGPHRHDIRFLFNGKDSRYFCSQGQQRSIILSYKMAQIMYHYKIHQVYPFLLLDDVLSELDTDKRFNLVQFLKGIPSQIFLTTTDVSFPLDFGDRKLSVFRIEKGVLISARDSTSDARL